MDPRRATAEPVPPGGGGALSGRLTQDALQQDGGARDACSRPLRVTRFYPPARRRMIAADAPYCFDPNDKPARSGAQGGDTVMTIITRRTLGLAAAGALLGAHARAQSSATSGLPRTYSGTT